MEITAKKRKENSGVILYSLNVRTTFGEDLDFYVGIWRNIIYSDVSLTDANWFQTVSHAILDTYFDYG